MGLAPISFGPFTLDRGAAVLLSSGKPVVIGHRALALLQALAAADGPVTKEALIEAAWPGTIVEEGNLTVQVAALRKALGTRADGQEWIVTVPRVGYRLSRAGSSLEPETFESKSPLPSLAVLPFQNLSGDAAEEYFADGVVEDLITALNRFKSFAVIARNSSFVYKGRSVDVRQVAAELGARYVLEGAVRRAGVKLRVTAQLVDATTGAQLWATKIDGAVEDVFDVQDQITQGVAALIEPKIHQAEIARARLARPATLGAYEQYLQARQKLGTMAADDNAAAIAILEAVVAKHPTYAIAVAALANAYEHRVTSHWPATSDDDTGRCLRYARAALALDSSDPKLLVWCGIALQVVGQDHDAAIAALTRALELNPNDVLVLEGAGVAHFWGGHLDYALALFQRAVGLGPGVSPIGTLGIAHAMMCRGNYEEALLWIGRSLIENPNHEISHWVKVAAYAHLGRMDAAKQALADYNLLDQGLSVARVRAHGPFKDRSRMNAIANGLRLAGVPEY